MVETALLKHFNLKESYLHSLNAYDPVKNAYLFPGLVGGGSFQVDKVTKDSKLVTIDFHYDDDISKETLKKVTLVAEEVPEGFKYLSCKTKTVYPLLADLEKTSKTTEPKIVPSASSGWSYTDRPKVYRFNRGRDISGLEFKFTVVLNGKYKIGYPNIPLYVGINHFINRNGY